MMLLAISIHSGPLRCLSRFFCRYDHNRPMALATSEIRPSSPSAVALMESASESHKSSNLFIGMSKLDEVEFEQLEAELNPVLSRLHDKFGRMPTMMELDENTAKVYRRYKQLRQALGRDR